VLPRRSVLTQQVAAVFCWKNDALAAILKF